MGRQQRLREDIVEGADAQEADDNGLVDRVTCAENGREIFRGGSAAAPG